MTEDRLNRVELKLDRLQEQSHINHMEMLSCFQSAKDEAQEEINSLKMKVDRHESYFAMVLKALGLGGIITSWLSLRDLFPHSK